MKKSPKKVAFLWQLGVCFLCSPNCPKLPRTSFSFNKFFSTIICSKICGLNLPEFDISVEPIQTRGCDPTPPPPLNFHNFLRHWENIRKEVIPRCSIRDNYYHCYSINATLTGRRASKIFLCITMFGWALAMAFIDT